MFCVEYFTNTKSYKRIENKMSPKLSYKEFGLGERIVGIILWPIWLGVFLYNFFKQLFK